MPESHGGPGADFLCAVIIIEELAKSNFSGLGVRLHRDVATPYFLDFSTEEQKLRYIPRCVSGDIITAIGMTEPCAGSDLSAIQTTAAEDGQEIVINGQKTFISKASTAT
jgi:acyl-CoA dehydrogenase